MPGQLKSLTALVRSIRTARRMETRAISTLNRNMVAFGVRIERAGLGAPASNGHGARRRHVCKRCGARVGTSLDSRLAALELARHVQAAHATGNKRGGIVKPGTPVPKGLRLKIIRFKSQWGRVVTRHLHVRA